MKFSDFEKLDVSGESPPSRGAWIEMAGFGRVTVNTMSPPSRGAWIEITKGLGSRTGEYMGRPPRGGRGLKYSTAILPVVNPLVAPLAGGVD